MKFRLQPRGHSPETGSGKLVSVGATVAFEELIIETGNVANIPHRGFKTKIQCKKIAFT